MSKQTPDDSHHVDLHDAYWAAWNAKQDELWEEYRPECQCQEGRPDVCPHCTARY